MMVAIVETTSESKHRGRTQRRRPGVQLPRKIHQRSIDIRFSEYPSAARAGTIAEADKTVVLLLALKALKWSSQFGHSNTIAEILGSSF